MPKISELRDSLARVEDAYLQYKPLVDAYLDPDDVENVLGAAFGFVYLQDTSEINFLPDPLWKRALRSVGDLFR